MTKAAATGSGSEVTTTTTGNWLQIGFDDGSSKEIDFEPVLEGELYGPLRDAELFAKVEVDPAVRTLVWPNGADFDPSILHDWPEHEEAMRSLARRWGLPACSGLRTSPFHRAAGAEV